MKDLKFQFKCEYIMCDRYGLLFEIAYSPKNTSLKAFQEMSQMQCVCLN